MKKLFLMLAAVMAIALPKAAQAVDVEGFYAGGLGGLNFLQYHRDHVKVHFKAGWIAGLHAGYRWCNGLRLEGEVSYRHNKNKSVKFRGFETRHIGGHLQTWSFMANGYYEIPLCWCVVPYIGAGIGYDATRFDACRSDSSFRDRGHKNGFAWQVIAGGLYPIDDCMELGLEYRFHHGKIKDLYNHTVDLRLNWFF